MEMAIEMDPNLAEAYEHLGIYWDGLRDKPEKAREYLREGRAVARREHCLMCNRYSQTKDRIKLETEFAGIIVAEVCKRDNIAPTDTADVVCVENGKLVCREMKWGWPTKQYGVVTNAKGRDRYAKDVEARVGYRAVLDSR